MRRAGVILSIGLISLVVSGIPARAAALDGPPQIAGLELGQSSVAVSGLNVARVTVSVRLTDQDGVDMVGELGFVSTPDVWVSSVADDVGELVGLNLASGTVYDGWWQGDLYVPSRFNGEFRVASVNAYDTQYQELLADPASSGFDPRLTVVGTDPPSLSGGFSPSPVLYGNNISLKGRLIHKETGAGWPGVQIKVEGVFGDCCSVLKTLTTDSNGYYGMTESTTQCCPDFTFAAVAYSAGDSTQRGFFVVSSYPKRPRIWWQVWAHPATTKMRLGTSQTVTGSVAPAAAATDVYLQRLVSGTWKTVATAHSHSSGRFYLTAHPPSRGYQRYRVLIPGAYGFIATATKTFTIYVY